MNCTVTLEPPVPLELEEEFCKKLGFISEAVLSFSFNSGSPQVVKLTLHDHDAPDPALLERSIQSLARSVSSTRLPETKTLVQSLGTGKYSKDPHQELISRGEIVAFGPGRHGFGPRMLLLLEALDREIKSYGSRIGAISRSYPSLIASGDLQKCRYMSAFPNSLCFVQHLREDLEVIRSFSSSVSVEHGKAKFESSVLTPPECLLSPNICFHTYSSLAGSRIGSTIVTAAGKCFRYESRSLAALDRLWEFNMREIIFLGSQDFVVESRSAAIESLTTMFKEWGLDFRVSTATDPFFTDDFASLATFQLAFELKFEMLTTIPYLGKPIAAGSFNYHRDFFGESFDIRQRNSNEVVHTACVGFGLERLALAHLAQFGVEETLLRFDIEP